MEKGTMKILVLSGGPSAEHEISLLSAGFICSELHKKHDVFLVYITKEGIWYGLSDIEEASKNPRSIPEHAFAHAQRVWLLPAENGASLCALDSYDVVFSPDVVFPALHGPGGEDGTIQGLCSVLQIPCVGADVLGSALAMDKVSTKRILRDVGLPVPDFVAFDYREWYARKRHILNDIQKMETELWFVKPSNLGSSIGITRVTDTEMLESAIEHAFEYDEAVLVEQGIPDCREVEVSVLDGKPPKSSLPGEIRYRQAFYDYEAKYLDDATELIIPAQVNPVVFSEVRHLAIRAFLALRCRGMARVDFFVQDQKIFINELNTIPGFTPYSMYHRLWEKTGLPVQTLLETLIQCALEDRSRKKNLKKQPDIRSIET